MTKVYPTSDHPLIKVGMKFEHNKVLDEKDFKNPAICVVTKVKDGFVYWRLWNSIKTRDYFPVSETSRWIKRWVK